MASKVYTAAILLFWVAAMGWLVVEKIVPTLIAGDVPSYEITESEPDQPPPVTVWLIQWQGREIGHIVSSPIPVDDQHTQLRSLLVFRNLPLNALMESLLGNMGRVVGPALGTPESLAKLEVATRLNVDKADGMKGFETVLSMEGMPRLMVVEGERLSGNKLKVSAISPHLRDENGDTTALTETTMDLPKEALVADFISPRDRLKDLQVGRWWNFPVYRVFPPSTEGQLVKAVVERYSPNPIHFGNQDVHPLEVVYYPDAGSGINREPIGRAWVSEDGLILKQEFRVSTQTFVFERLPDSAAELYREALEDRAFSRYFETDDTIDP